MTEEGWRQVRFDRAVTGVAMSPSGDFVCTSHAGSLGIYLWANRTHFANVFLGYSAPTDATGPRASRLLHPLSPCTGLHLLAPSPLRAPSPPAAALQPLHCKASVGSGG